jgi:F420-dependent oxidoreductase-like protein
MALRLPSPTLVVLIGPSGAGKSTWAADNFSPDQIVSSDRLRAMVGAGEDDQAAGTAAFEILDRVVTERLSRGLTTVIDTLGFHAESRERWLQLARDAAVPAHAVLFDTPGDVCLARNDSRPRPLPKTVVRRQIGRFPKVRREVASEGFDGIHVEQPVELVAPQVLVATPEGEPAVGGASRPATGHTFGLMVSRFDWGGNDLGEELASIARRAEAAGFRDIWVMDHLRQIRGVGRPWEDIPEAFVTLGFLAGVTSTIRIGPLVTGITHRNPLLLGKMLASLDVLSGGRVNCGLGVAWDEEEHAAYGLAFPGTGERFEILEETLQVLPLLWGKGTPGFHGKHIHSDELICYPRPLQDPIPILVGGAGERRTLRLAARYGDACNVFGDPARVAHKVRVLHEHCAELGRDPDLVEVTHLTNAVAASSRREVQEKVESLRDRNTSAERYMARHNAGTVDDLVALFTAYHEAGAAHSIVALPDVGAEGSIETFGDVIAAFSSP